MPINILFVSAPCAAHGKTFAAVDYIKSIMPLTNVLYVGLTGAVLDNAEREFKGAGVDYKRIRILARMKAMFLLTHRRDKSGTGEWLRDPGNLGGICRAQVFQ